MVEALLDTDILSEVLKAKNVQVLAHAEQYIREHGQLAFSAITFYEVLRWILAKRATKQLATFTQFTKSCDIVPITSSILERGSELWASAHQRGRPQNDADLIIAATALETGRVLVTGNTKHHDWIDGLRIDNWRQS